jgi:recombination protein RecR
VPESEAQRFMFPSYFCPMNLSSKLLEEAVQAFATLPGIGRKTALRLALHLVNREPEYTRQFAQTLLQMREGICECEICNNLADSQYCVVCKDSRRDRSLICVVESIRDVMAIEETGQYRGLYHVLGGVISPIEGVGPEQLHIEGLLHRVAEGEVKEVIMAINPTIEGDTTIFYITKKLRNSEVKVTTIARGVAFGGELEYADELTLGRSIAARLPYTLDENP